VRIPRIEIEHERPFAIYHSHIQDKIHASRRHFSPYGLPVIFLEAGRSVELVLVETSSSRLASAVSRRPTTRMAEFAVMRRSTSLAVCSAPMRMMPSERSRSATSRRVSLIGLVPSRGAYLRTC